MKKRTKSIVYFLASWPNIALAQVKIGSNPPEAPSLAVAFSSISSFLYLILGGIGILSIVGIIISALDYMAASSDEERVGRSGKTFGFSIVGLIVSVVGIIIINVASGIIGNN